MIKNLSNKILQIRSATGMEVCIQQNNELLLNLVSIKLSKGRLVKLSEHHSINSLDESKNKADISCPIALTITGKGVIFKRVPTSELGENPLQLVLPTANPNDFYIEITKTSRDAYLSVIRKDLADKLISNLKLIGFKILSFSICGFKDLLNILPLITYDSAIIQTSQYQFFLGNDNSLENIESIKFDIQSAERSEINVGDQYVFSTGLLAFAAGTSLIAHSAALNTPHPIHSISKERKDFIYFKWYKSALIILPSFILIILILNLLGYNYFLRKNLEFGFTKSISLMEGEKKSALSSEINKKESFITQNGWNLQSKISLISDRIASMVAGSVVLNSMIVYPSSSKDLAKNETPIFKRNVIEISGICYDPEDLNVFINNIRESSFFKEVNIRNYQYKRESGNGYFSLEIYTNQ